jgi:halimadienyl-diphosphate synthase
MKAGWSNDPNVRWAASELSNFWNKDGVAWGSEFPCIDSDTTALTFKVLRDSGYRPDPCVFDPFELEDGFKCFQFEMNPSTSCNIHILEAFHDMPRSDLPRKDEVMDKLVRFLEKTIIDGERWVDKWHVSPYYSTGHAIMALSEVAPHILEGPIDWILRTQNQDGGWGAFDTSTSEETAYALQALVEYAYRVEPLDEKAMSKATCFLRSRLGDVFERLWISKGLYCPVNVVMSSVLSALRMSTQYHQTDILQERALSSVRTDVVKVEHHGGV